MIRAGSVIAVLLAAVPAAADGPVKAREGVSVGGTLHRFQDDFGIGAALASPHFAGGRLRVTLAGGISWYPYAADAAGDQEWAPYGDMRLVVEGGERAPGSPVRLYGFGGPSLFIVPDRLSETRVSVGGIGGFGFEYYFTATGRDGPISYFTEAGGIGSGARADRLDGKPLLGNGFFVTAGLRWTL